MTKRQPSLRETREAIKFNARLLARSVDDYPLTEAALVKGDSWGIPRHVGTCIVRLAGRSRYRMRCLDPCSDVSERCDDCGRILVDRYGGRRWVDKDPEANVLRHKWADRSGYKTVCFGCERKQLPLLRAVREYAENRRAINRLRRKVYEQNKQQRPASDVLAGHDGEGG